MAGGHGRGDALNQLYHPYGLNAEGDGTLYIADTSNNRIVRWKPNALEGEIILDELNQPYAVLIDRINDCLIVSDSENKRLLRWSLENDLHNNTDGDVIISDIVSYGLAMGAEGSLYVSDFEKHEVRRYGRTDGPEGMTVAGGNGRGVALNQLYHPRNIFVDDEYSVYISDAWNDRVMKWMRNAKEGVVVAGGLGEGTGLRQLCTPSGLFVDRMGSVYVADQRNHRVMRWLKDGKEGEVILGGNGEGSENNQLYWPKSISLDDQGNLYVTDKQNDRIRRFDIQTDSP